MRILLLPPVAVFMAICLMLALHASLPIAYWLAPPFNWLGLVLVLCGFGTASWHARLFRRLHTNINTFGEPGSLTREGLFRHTRNPMYLGMLVMLIGTACVLGSLSPLVGPLCFFLLAHFWYIPVEEKAMASKFTDAYREYRRSVRRWV
ncbi:MAG: isoprenylcysteine carboxylmethyltransferase family protein [Pseudomonadota bacterium]